MQDALRSTLAATDPNQRRTTAASLLAALDSTSCVANLPCVKTFWSCAGLLTQEITGKRSKIRLCVYDLNRVLKHSCLQKLLLLAGVAGHDHWKTSSE